MSDKYKIHDREKAYFLIFTVVDWINVFTLRSKMDELEFIVQNGFSSKVDTVNAPCKLIFNEEPNQLYGFDKYETHFKDKYQKIHFNGEDYYIPWKSLKTGTTDKVLLDFTCTEESGIEYENVKFKSSMGFTINSTYNDGTFTLTIPAAMDNDVDKIEAYIEDGDNTITLGRLNSVSFDMINQEVVIVPVGGNILPNSITAQQVQTELNKIYKGAIVNWTVALDNSLYTLQPSEWDNNSNNLLNCQVSDYFAYTSEMNNLIDHFNEKSVVDDEKLYLFLVFGDEAQEKNGIMPFGKQFGFIMVGGTKNQTLQQLSRTMAHELGHGAFGLMHPWQEFNGTPAEGTTENLMDYSTGTKLRKYQWYYIHNPRWHFGGGSEEEVAEKEGAILNGIFTGTEVYAHLEFWCFFYSNEDIEDLTFDELISLFEKNFKNKYPFTSQTKLKYNYFSVFEGEVGVIDIAFLNGDKKYDKLTKCYIKPIFKVGILTYEEAMKEIKRNKSKNINFIYVEKNNERIAAHNYLGSNQSIATDTILNLRGVELVVKHELFHSVAKYVNDLDEFGQLFFGSHNRVDDGTEDTEFSIMSSRALAPEMKYTQRDFDVNGKLQSSDFRK